MDTRLRLYYIVSIRHTEEVISTAEFCLDCWNEMNGTHYTPEQVVLEEDLCEGCGEWKPVVVGLRGSPLTDWFRGIYGRLEDWAARRRARGK